MTADEGLQTTDGRGAASMLILIVLLVFAPLAFGAVEYGSTAIVEWLALLLAGAWLAGSIRGRALFIETNLMVWAATGFALWAGVQWLLRLTLDPAGTREALTLFVAYFLVFIVVSNEPWPARSVEQLGVAISMIGFGVALFGLVQFLSWNGKLYWVRAIREGTPFGPYVNHNHFAGLMEMTVPVTLGLIFGRGRDRTGRSLLALLAAIMVVATLASLSRGGLVGLAAGMATFFYLRARRRGARGTLPVLGFGAVLVAAGLWLIGVIPVMERVLTFANMGQEASFQSRFWIARDTLGIIREHFFAGTGLSTFPVVIPRYLSFYSRWSWEKAHNDYLQLAAETGFVGFALALGWLAGFWRAFRQRWYSPGASSLRLGAFCGCLAILVHSLVDFNLQIPANAVFFTVLAALATRDEKWAVARSRRALAGATNGLRATSSS